MKTRGKFEDSKKKKKKNCTRYSYLIGGLVFTNEPIMNRWNICYWFSNKIGRNQCYTS